MNNLWAFRPMQPSNELLGDPSALRQRLDEDGYLYFARVLDPERVLKVRRAIATALAECGWVKGGRQLMKAIAVTEAVREGDDEFFTAYDAVQRLEEFHTLAHDDDLMAVVRDVVGETAFPHPLKIARLSFPAHYEVSTPPHQDYPNNQGTPSLTAAWIPAGDCPRELGPVAVLRGSHKYGVLPLDWHLGAGNRQAVVSDEMLDALRWVTTDFSAGDVLLFPALTVHASLHNCSEFHFRLSVDYRYQQEGEALTAPCLQPHFQRLDWADIYANWRSTKYQYYWKNLDYVVDRFEEFPVPRPDQPTAAEVQQGLKFERRRAARFQRRLDRVATLDEPDIAAEP